jgi:hypothetical protein
VSLFCNHKTTALHLLSSSLKTSSKETSVTVTNVIGRRQRSCEKWAVCCEYVIHVEVVPLVTMIAIAGHAIDVDFNKVPPQPMIGIGAIIVALTIGYYYVKKPVFWAHKETAVFRQLNKETKR